MLLKMLVILLAQNSQLCCRYGASSYQYQTEEGHSVDRKWPKIQEYTQCLKFTSVVLTPATSPVHGRHITRSGKSKRYVGAIYTCIQSICLHISLCKINCACFQTCALACAMLKIMEQELENNEDFHCGLEENCDVLLCIFRHIEIFLLSETWIGSSESWYLGAQLDYKLLHYISVSSSEIKHGSVLWPLQSSTKSVILNLSWSCAFLIYTMCWYATPWH